jgi:stage II sporulation protein P
MATLWLLWLTADFSAAGDALKALASDADLAVTLLGTELGGSENTPLSGLDRLALAQSALLSANLSLVLRQSDEQTEDTPEESAAPSPSVSPQPDQEDDPAVVTTTAPDDIIGRTMVPGSSQRYVSQDGIYIYNYTDYELDISQLASSFPEDLLSDSDVPQILIYHSHTTEAYTMDGTDIYEESDSSRTTDPEYNMIRIGEEMKEVFEAAGLSVIHDDTLYDYPVYTGAYGRSAEAVAAILEQYPSIRLVLDVHRDALAGSDGTVYKTVAGTVENSAQVMLVVGSDAGGQTHDTWRSNLSLAVGLQTAVQEEYGTLIRPIVLRSSRFNQHLSTGALLVEVGSHGNTLQEAITAARLFAQSISKALQ